MSGTESPDGERPGLFEVHLESLEPIVMMVALVVIFNEDDGESFQSG